MVKTPSGASSNASRLPDYRAPADGILGIVLMLLLAPLRLRLWPPVMNGYNDDSVSMGIVAGRSPRGARSDGA